MPRSDPPESRTSGTDAPVQAAVAALAHGIRNPLAAAIAHLEVLTVREPLSQEGRASAGRIANELDRIRSILEDLTELTVAPAVHPRPLRLDGWMREHRPLFEAFAAARGVKLHVSAPTDATRAAESGALSVLGDPQVLRRAVLRLLQNSIEAGAAAIEIAVLSTALGAAVVVTDRAPYGGPPGPLAIRPFETTKARNTGLGLELVRRALARLGATVRVERTAQGETRAALVLARAERASEEAEG